LAGCRSTISLLLKFELISNTNAQLIQILITSYHQKRTRKKREREKKEEQSITRLKEKGGKTVRGVAAFPCKAE